MLIHVHVGDLGLYLYFNIAECFAPNMTLPMDALDKHRNAFYKELVNKTGFDGVLSLMSRLTFI